MAKLTAFLIIYMALHGCALPDQPPLTKKEKVFIDSLKQADSCLVERGINEVVLGRFYKKGRKGSYFLDCQLNCERLLHLPVKVAEDKAFKIAKRLYNHVLERDPKYDKIWVSFVCDTTSSNYKDKIYTYKIDTLH